MVRDGVRPCNTALPSRDLSVDPAGAHHTASLSVEHALTLGTVDPMFEAYPVPILGYT
jgi:hypothetical protein